MRTKRGQLHDEVPNALAPAKGSLGAICEDFWPLSTLLALRRNHVGPWHVHIRHVLGWVEDTWATSMVSSSTLGREPNELRWRDLSTGAS
jgi:hypothetical protein